MSDRSQSSSRPRRSCLLVMLCALAAVTCPTAARAELVQAGTWPEASPKVSLDAVRVSRSEALARLAKAANLSLMYRGPEGEPIDLHVKRLPADQVLGALFADGRYRAERSGDLISISVIETPSAAPDAGAAASAATSGGAPAAPVTPTPLAPSAAATPALGPTTPALSASPAGANSDGQRGEDRMVAGSSVIISRHELVRDLTVVGGNVDIRGIVTGDLAVMGGSATLRSGAQVEGDVEVVGGKLKLEDDAVVRGDVAVTGGRLDRGSGSTILGELQTSEPADSKPGVSSGEERVMSLMERVGSALTSSALLFAFGVVLIALATSRMFVLTKEVTLRPMRSFALGIVGWLAASLIFIVLCVTLIGIPLALLGVLVIVFFSYAGICAVLTTVGSAMIQHRTKNPYAHLALGCAVFLVLGAVPWLGGFVTFTVVTIGFGAVIAGRQAVLSTKALPSAA